MTEVKIGGLTVGNDLPLLVIAGPCQLESLDHAQMIAGAMAAACAAAGAQYVFKASYDKANRTSLSGKRGLGMEAGLKVLQAVHAMGLPVLTDVHDAGQAREAATVVDVIQIPAFLCRQTDLLLAAAATGKPLHVKKAQFLSPHDMKHVVEKCRGGGASSVLLCERGTFMGYGQLVVDMRSLSLMRSLGCPVVFDATHSVQMPGAAGGASGGDRRFILPLARAAVAAGIDALFLETHPCPEKAKSDGPNLVPLKKLSYLLEELLELHRVVSGSLGMPSLDWASEGDN